jgi:hypothetical protein
MQRLGLRLLSATLLAGTLSVGSASAASHEGFAERVAELVQWIAANSDYAPQLRHPPRFMFLSPDQIRHTFSGAAMGYRSETSSVRAAQTNGTIYLPETFTLGRDDYVLVHELVHHLQDESGKKFECLAAREREAYILQTKFVQERGVGEVPNDMYMLLLRCDVR